MSNKRMIIANFNVVFGESEQPLLKHFDSIVLPAFSKGFKNISGDNEYRFMNVQLVDTKKETLALTGIIVKKTFVEIKSKFNEDGNLIETDEEYATAPYSLFVIHLNNHRMTLVKNQKGSPELKSFSSTFRKMLASYIRSENRIRKEKELELLPLPEINIVGIPMRDSIEDALRKVKKINKLTLRFYPLNGDLDFSGLFDGITSDLRKIVGSKTGSLVLNSPTSVDGVIDVIDAAQGTIDPLFNVTYLDKTKGTISNNMISESMEINLDEMGDINSELDQIIDKTKDIESLNYVSEENQKIYNDNKCKVIPFMKRKK